MNRLKNKAEGGDYETKYFQRCIGFSRTTNKIDLFGRYLKHYKSWTEKINIKTKKAKALQDSNFEDCDKNRTFKDCMLQRYERNFLLNEDHEKLKFEAFLVPHSHQDLGWLKTYNEYYKKGKILSLFFI